jgi:hypothetical protein
MAPESPPEESLGGGDVSFAAQQESTVFPSLSTAR